MTVHPVHAAPTQTPMAARTLVTFRALLAALSSPGEVIALPAGHDPFALIGETLLDLETSFHTPDAALRARLGDTGARPLPAHEADYIFFPVLDDAALAALREARRGDPLEPQRAATVIIGTTFVGDAVTLRGPGISGVRRAALGLPPAFWTQRLAALSYPLGWDAFLVAPDAVAGLPRTTRVEVD
ncbi:alpha-D-ribose 1-methylphosphonate 5-triphosphate synthase subunit PhnH [Deinococcus metalli]|uniref:Alpha-D-ribose 1-methylphosphonate 5-triphosphate synthase subunit PhnH n=1 Tax=Deinococcus metalli TaxID=1141878 RepID=A0A7W8NSN6_9DEIO|nr:phosphonate C-P lyase system protein PhnH [Deinococcus metalli]MBB5379145.1 alpha-D-ribose 1-methylphosphonate 5-triphosphate synthase subunit PhnH [Deinococcus metalli]GHF64904.1 carbon-phosphorus lyase subunit PhnH [Deinococcus metalli]